MKYSIVAIVPVLLGSVSAQLGDVTDALKPVNNALKPVTDALEPVTDALEPVADAAQGGGSRGNDGLLGDIKLDGDIGLDISDEDDAGDKSGINVNMLGTNINAKVCLGVEVPSLIKAVVDIGCPDSPPPKGYTHVWHPEHPGVYIDDCDDDEATGWHYVHKGEPKNPDQGHYVWTATAATATTTHTVNHGGNHYTSVEAVEATTVCPVSAPAGYAPPATQVYVPLTSAGLPAATVPAYANTWETKTIVVATATATATPGSGSGPWYGSGSGSGSGSNHGTNYGSGSNHGTDYGSGSGSHYGSGADAGSGSGSGSAAGTPAPGVCPGPSCPPGESTVVIPVVPVPSGSGEGSAAETPGAVNTPVVTAGASRNVAGVLGLLFAVAALF